MRADHQGYVRPFIDDGEILAHLSADLAELLRQVNGFIQFEGGLHVRGACQQPAWHSLRNAWFGDDGFHSLYDDVQAEDVPFGQDCMGDQFLLRGGRVWRLSAETGAMQSLDVPLNDFLRAAQADPVGYLSLQPLLQFQREGGTLEPGQLLGAYPPFCFRQSTAGVHLAAVSAAEQRRFLAHLAAQLRDVPEGGEVVFKIAD